MRHLLLSAFLLLILSPAWSQTKSNNISFYFSAHPDDWQLFMGVNAFKDIAAASTGNGNKVVFIYTTAGEANCSGAGVDKDYYLSRQEGAIRSTQFCSDIYSPHSAWHSTQITLPGHENHSILQLTYKNIVCYFLRLPDGCLEGTPISMTKLASGVNSSLSAVDSTTTYHGYEDLVETVKNLVDYETSTLSQPQVWLHASDWDATYNIWDHPDHVQTGRLATEVASRLNYANIALHAGYFTCNEAPNLSPEEVAMEASMQSQVSFGMTHNGWLSEWDPDNDCGHVSWTSRNYYRIYSTASVNNALATFLTIGPNPTTNQLNITYKVMESGPVDIVIFDMAGNSRATVVCDNEITGEYTINYNAITLPPANYIIYAKTPGHSSYIKFTKL